MTRARVNRLDQVKKARFDAKGYTPFYTFPIGETLIQLLHQQPTPNTNYPNRMNFAIKVDDESYTWSVTMTSPIYQELIEAFQHGKTNITVVRSGQVLQTRWSLKHDTSS